MIIGLTAVGLAVGGFETGRYSVDAAAVAGNFSPKENQSLAILHPNSEPFPVRQDQIIIRDIATVPFSQLYDVLKAAPREQLLAWARDLEQMPRGPRQRAAVAAYYKSLVQVDHHAALKALSESSKLFLRDVGEDALLKAAPESIWGEIAEALVRMPYPGRGWGEEDVILNWSRVDPVAASKFIERHSYGAEQKRPDGEDARILSLLTNWGETDPIAARTWLEADASHQSKGAFQAILPSWGRVDPAGAIDYAVQNAAQPVFEAAINDLVYDFVRSNKNHATRLLLLLPFERAKAAMKNIAEITNPEVIDPNLDRPPDYQRPADEVARWMVSLPVELWSESLGVVVQGWMREDSPSATNWFGQLRSDIREVALVNLCSVRQSASREEVLKLAFTINDTRLREKALGNVVRSLRGGGEDAMEAIDDLSFSDEQKAYLRRVLLKDSNGR